MRIKCLFCKYRAVCIPEQEDGLTKYSRLKKSYNLLVHDYTELATKYINLRANLENYIQENESRK